MLNLTYIRDRATTLKFSDSSLALACNVSVDTFSRWLSGATLPRPRSLRALALALQSEVGDIIEDHVSATVTWIGATKQLATMDRERAELEAGDMARQLGTLRAYIETRPARPEEQLPAYSGPDFRVLDEQVQRHLQAGNILVPVRWDVPLKPFVAAVIRPLDSKGTFVYVNLKNNWRNVAHALALALEVPDTKGVAQANEFLHMPVSDTASQSRAPLADVAHATFVAESEKIFATPVFQALSDFQRFEGGCDAAFISSLLGIHIFEAHRLAQVLNQK